MNTKADISSRARALSAALRKAGLPGAQAKPPWCELGEYQTLVRADGTTSISVEPDACYFGYASVAPGEPRHPTPWDDSDPKQFKALVRRVVAEVVRQRRKDEAERVRYRAWSRA